MSAIARLLASFPACELDPTPAESKICASDVRSGSVGWNRARAQADGRNTSRLELQRRPTPASAALFMSDMIQTLDGQPSERSCRSEINELGAAFSRQVARRGTGQPQSEIWKHKTASVYKASFERAKQQATEAADTAATVVSSEALPGFASLVIGGRRLVRWCVRDGANCGADEHHAPGRLGYPIQGDFQRPDDIGRVQQDVSSLRRR